MDSFTNFWAATTAAATVATAIATSVALWVQRRNKPWPVWRITGDLYDPYDVAGEPTANLEGRAYLHNVGDGAAYSVEIEAIDCEVSFLAHGIVSKVEPDGEIQNVYVKVKYPVPTGARINIIWINAPVRLRQSWVQTFWLEEELDVTGMDNAPGRKPRSPQREHKPIRLPR